VCSGIDNTWHKTYTYNKQTDCKDPQEDLPILSKDCDLSVELINNAMSIEAGAKMGIR